MVSKKYNKVFLTGCDASSEWMLPWFLKNYKKYHQTPLIFADFGVTELTLQIMKENSHAIIDMTKVKEKGWFKKPKAMLNSPSHKTVWIDTDCQILENCDSIFDLIEPNKLLMAEDKPWSKRRKEVWHNSGVVGFTGKPEILQSWAYQIMENPHVGDQEVLHSMLDPLSKMTYIKDLPNEYNVLRLQEEIDGYRGKKKIIHWTGRKGKDKIRSMMNG